tara:strand:+ start:516 stop:797 length:282 start_codon:yes stop_codon:yes gene_type:complete
MNKVRVGVNPFWTFQTFNTLTKHDLLVFMSTESLQDSNNIMKDPSHYVSDQKTTDVNILKRRLHQEKKKEKFIRNVVLSSVVVSLGALSILIY